MEKEGYPNFNMRLRSRNYFANWILYSHKGYERPFDLHFRWLISKKLYVHYLQHVNSTFFTTKLSNDCWSNFCGMSVTNLISGRRYSFAHISDELANISLLIVVVFLEFLYMARYEPLPELVGVRPTSFIRCSRMPTLTAPNLLFFKSVSATRSAGIAF